MQKLKLTVPQPCQENWDNLTPEQKGRFCAACQKTVVDFTNMSDEQLAAFFRKPAGAVCGRFYKKQLNREIPVSEKRLSLPKHFFRYTWPAFLLLLKACNEREEIVGELNIKQEQKLPDMPPS